MLAVYPRPAVYGSVPSAGRFPRIRRSVWQLDPRYWRVEPLDAQGRSLGIIYFELQSSGLQRRAA